MFLKFLALIFKVNCSFCKVLLLLTWNIYHKGYLMSFLRLNMHEYKWDSLESIPVVSWFISQGSCHRGYFSWVISDLLKMPECEGWASISRLLIFNIIISQDFSHLRYCRLTLMWSIHVPTAVCRSHKTCLTWDISDLLGCEVDFQQGLAVAHMSDVSIQGPCIGLDTKSILRTSVQACIYRKNHNHGCIYVHLRKLTKFIGVEEA